MGVSHGATCETNGVSGASLGLIRFGAWEPEKGATPFKHPLKLACTQQILQKWCPWKQHIITRPRFARKHNIASEVGPTLQDAFFFPTRSIREASARQHQARCSAQVALRKLHCASCSVQVARRKLLRASCSVQVGPCQWLLQVALCKLLRASCSVQIAPCKLLCANCSVQVHPCKLLCASCSVQVALCKLLCVSCSAQVALGKALCANWSVQVGLRKLLCATCSAQVALRKLLYASCILRRPPADQKGIEPGTRRSREQAREPRDNSRGPVRTTKVGKSPEFLHAPRPRRSPQRVARAPQKSQKTLVFAPRPRRSPQRVAREL